MTEAATPVATPAAPAAPVVQPVAAAPAAPVPPAPAPPAAPPAPAPAPTPAAVPAVAPQAPTSQPQDQPAPASADVPDDGKHPWLPKRLEDARSAAVNKLLADLGVENLDAAKGRLAKLSELEKAQMTEAERTQALIDELKPKAERVSKVEGLLAQMVEQQFAKLPEQAQAAIDATANGNPEQRLALMQVLQAAGSVQQPEAPQVPAPVAQPPAAPVPATTTPNAPAPPAPTQAQTHYEIWQAKVKANDRTANLYHQMNRAQIELSRPQ